jgi:hypothetical protein
MNKQRRAKLRSLLDRVTAIKDELAEIKDEEDGALSNLPESLQNSSRGEAMQAAIDGLDGVDVDLDSAIDALSELSQQT